MPKSVYDYHEYRDFIRQRIDENHAVRGYQKKMAEFAGCKSSFFSQVLNTHVHLTPDHAAGLSAFWQFDAHETDYFIGLVNFARAQSKYLKKNVGDHLTALRKQRENITVQLKEPPRLNHDQEVIYYASWFYGAIHMIVGIAGYQSSEAIARKLKLSPSTVEHALEQLAQMHLVVKTPTGWSRINSKLHLPKDSSLTSVNHAGWRQLALCKLQERSDDDLHYTSAHSLGKKEFEKVKRLITDCIAKSREIIDPAPDEEVAVFLCDFFKLV